MLARTVPGGITTLDQLKVGMEAEVSALLGGGKCRHLRYFGLRPGTRFICRDQGFDRIVVETSEGQMIAIPRKCACYVQLKRFGVGLPPAPVNRWTARPRRFPW